MKAPKLGAFIVVLRLGSTSVRNRCEGTDLADRPERWSEVGVATLFPFPGEWHTSATQRSATSRVPKVLPNADHLLSLVPGFCHARETNGSNFRESRSLSSTRR